MTIGNSIEIRRRWRRERKALELIDSESTNFAIGGLARNALKLTVRLVVLPANLENSIPFSSETFDWWKSEKSTPLRMGRVFGWSVRTSSSAIISYRSDRDGSWREYLALRRDGGIDLGLAEPVTFQMSERQFLHLTGVVAMTWEALHRQRLVAGRFNLEGPWEIVLALRDSSKYLLGGLPEEWNGFRTGFMGTCIEPGILIRREISSWTEGDDDLQEVAFSLGERIANAWNYTQRVFLRRAGSEPGTIDENLMGW